MSREVVPRAKPSQRPRYRYVLFAVDSPSDLSRNDFIQALRRAAAPGSAEVWLTRFDGRHGVLRALRTHEDEASEQLRGLQRLGVIVRTLSTSGTIAALERRHRAAVPRQQPR